MPERFTTLDDLRSYLVSVNPQLDEHPPDFDFRGRPVRERTI